MHEENLLAKKEYPELTPEEKKELLGMAKRILSSENYDEFSKNRKIVHEFEVWLRGKVKQVRPEINDLNISSYILSHQLWQEVLHSTPSKKIIESGLFDIPLSAEDLKVEENLKAEEGLKDKGKISRGYIERFIRSLNK